MATSDRAKALFEMGEDPIVVRSGPEALPQVDAEASVSRPLRVMKLEPSAKSAGERRNYGSDEVLLVLGDQGAAAPKDETPAPAIPAADPPAAARLQGAFAKLPSLEPKPAVLPSHVDRDAKPTHTFGASALRDAVASLEHERELPKGPTESVLGAIAWDENYESDDSAPPSTSEQQAPKIPPATQKTAPRRDRRWGYGALALGGLMLLAAMVVRPGASGDASSPSGSASVLEPALVLEADPALEVPVVPDTEETALIEQDATGALDEGDAPGLVAAPEGTAMERAAEGENSDARTGPPTEDERRQLRRSLMKQLLAKAQRHAVELGQVYEQDFVFDWELHIKLAHAARLSDAPALALRWFTEFVERYPENIYVNDAAFWVAQLRWKSDGLDAAVSYLEETSRDPELGWSEAARAQLRRLLRKQAESE